MTKKERSPESQALLVKAVDGELSSQESARFEALLREDPSLSEELASLTVVHQTMARFGLRDPNPGDWVSFESSLQGRAGRFLGWLLLAAGLLILLGSSLYHLLADGEIPLPVKIGSGALAAGLAVLFIYVGRIFWRERRQDPYEDVVR